jgi:YihY family inner membrane protein
MSITDTIHTVDRRQQEIRGVRFVGAVLKKFGDDQGGQLAALVTYYGFVSLFPLLLVFVTVLGFILQGDHAEQQRVLNVTLGQFPLISTYLKLNAIEGSGVALAVGIVGSLLSGLGFTGAMQMAFNRIWSVPFKHRPNFISSRLRGLGLLALLGTISIVSTVAGGFVGTSDHSAPTVLAGIVVAMVANLALFMAAFKLLTATELDWRTLLPGVITASILWELLHILGGYYLDHILKRTGPLYGVFAVVLGLLAWLYLGSQLTMISAEVNVVRARGLWPRSFFSDPLLDTDRHALTRSAETDERVPEENIEVNFDAPQAGAPPDEHDDAPAEPSGHTR